MVLVVACDWVPHMRGVHAPCMLGTFSSRTRQLFLAALHARARMYVAQRPGVARPTSMTPRGQVLVNSAGVYGRRLPLEELEADDFMMAFR